MSYRELGQTEALEAIATSGSTALDFIIILPMAKHLNVIETDDRVPDPTGDVEKAKAHFGIIMPDVQF